MTPAHPDAMDLSHVELELTDDEGHEYRFAYAATIPYEGEAYVCLVELDPPEAGEEQVLITQVTREGEELKFQVVGDSAIIEPVFTLFLAQQHHHHHGCGCGHDHEHDHHHGHDHHHDHDHGCCGHHHDHPHAHVHEGEEEQA